MPKLEDFQRLEADQLVTSHLDENGFHTFYPSPEVPKKNLWYQNKHLLESRGIVFSPSGDLIHRPLPKVFNHRQNGVSLAEGTPVVMTKKIDGFSMRATRIDGRTYFSASTPEKTEIGRALLEQNPLGVKRLRRNMTYTFQINHRNEPNVIQESAMVYLVAIRDTQTGKVQPHSKVVSFGSTYGWATPEWCYTTFHMARQMTMNAPTAGVVIYDQHNNRPIMKLISPFYRAKQAMMDGGKRNIDIMFDRPEEFRQRIDRRFYKVHNAVLDLYDKITWRKMTDHQRRDALDKVL